MAKEDRLIEAAARLLLAGADAKADNSRDLIRAALQGHADIVQLLLAAGTDAKAKDSAALRFAALQGHADIVRLLIPVSGPKDFETALYWATEQGRTECAELLKAAIGR